MRLPCETAPIATMLPKETAVPTLIVAPLEPPSAPQPQSAAAGVESDLRRSLSSAAEQAIREGFVEINDPSVQACTDAKVANFRKERGEEVPLNYDAYNEFAVACGFNI